MVALVPALFGAPTPPPADKTEKTKKAEKKGEVVNNGQPAVKFQQVPYSKVMGRELDRLEKEKDAPSGEALKGGRRGSETAPGDAVSLEPYAYSGKRIFGEEAIEELRESAWRRFEVTFFISLPFTSLVSVGVLQGSNLALNRTAIRGMPYTHIAFVAVTGLGLSSLIAWLDMKRWLRYQKRVLKKIYLGPAPGGESASHRRGGLPVGWNQAARAPGRGEARFGLEVGRFLF